MSKYQTLQDVCTQCKEHVTLFTEGYIRSGQKYSFTCPYCKKESIIEASGGIPEDKLPNDAVRITFV
jgi:hypothetical protein